MGSSKGAGVVRFRIDPEKIGSALNFLMHYDGWRFIEVTLIGTLDVLINYKNFFFSAIEFLQTRTFFEKNISKLVALQFSCFSDQNYNQNCKEFCVNMLLTTGKVYICQQKRCR